jgi:cytoskeleton protein RodZ
MPTPGEKLRAAREGRNLSIAQVAKITRIRNYYIEAMEADDFSSMPSAVQARGFLRLYADFLGLDLDSLSENSPPDEAQETQKSERLEAQEEQENKLEEETEETLERENEPELESPGPGVSQPSEIFFGEIGSALRERRELLGLTLEEIERHTRIRKENLQIIEQAKFDNLPSPVQSRGMLKTYSSFLDMDSEAILLKFAEALQMRRAERQVTPPPAHRRPILPLWMRNILSPDLIFGSVLVLSITGLVLWGATRIIAAQEILEDELQAPSIVEVLLESPIETPTLEAIPTTNGEQDFTLSPEEAQEIPPEAPAPQQPGSILQVTLLVSERVFLRVIVDGQIRQDGRVAPGAALVFDGRERIEVLTGNGNAVRVIYNQFEFGAMGNPGEVVNRIYTLDGVQTPTPTISPTPSITPRFSPTPTPTVTGTPGATGIP